MKAKIGNFKHSFIFDQNYKSMLRYPIETIANYPTTRHIINSLLAVWKCGQTQSVVCDILLSLHQSQLENKK